MATTSSTTKTKPDNQNLTRSRSLGKKPKAVPSAEPDGPDRKTTEKPLPNYLKPTISSRPDPVKFVKKNNAHEDNQKLLRRRSFDRPPSSMTSPSTSSSHKSLNVSPARPRDRPVVPREKPLTALRSTSFHGRGGGLRGSSAVKSPPVVSKGAPGAKKSCLSGSTSSKSKKEASSENVPKKSSSSGKEITSESSPLVSAHEVEEEVVKVESLETDVHVSEEREEDKDEIAQPDESGEEKETGPVDAATKEEERSELINEDKPEEQVEPENIQENNSEDKEEAEKKVDDEENSETDVTTEMKETANDEESKEEAQVKEEEEVKEGTTETKAQVAEELPEEGTKKEVVQGKKESPSAYNDVIASKMQENSRKNKVLALAGAFQTVIDYETAASK